jgi:hypothetical protein
VIDMPEFKELMINKVAHSSLPHLRLNGKWLEKLGFTVGTSVSGVYQDSCLTLRTDDLKPSEACDFTTCVTSRLMRNKPRTQLFLNGFLLRKYGFELGDRLGLTLSPHTIQISKIIKYTTDAT